MKYKNLNSLEVTFSGFFFSDVLRRGKYFKLAKLKVGFFCNLNNLLILHKRE